MATVTLTITPVHDAPVAVADTVSTPEDSPVSVPVLGNDTDADGDPLSLVSVTTTNGTPSLVGTNVLYTPATNFHGTNVLTYCITDGSLTNCSTLTVTVTPVNDAPVTVNDTYNTLKNVPLTVSAPGVLGNDSDVENDALAALLGANVTRWDGRSGPS